MHRLVNALTAHHAVLQVPESVLEGDQELGQALGGPAIGDLEELGRVAQPLGPDAHFVQLGGRRVVVDSPGAFTQLAVGAAQTAWRIVEERSVEQRID